MARSSKAKSAEELSKTVSEATATATQNVLRMAAEAESGPNKAQQAETIAKLARICEEAVDHMAKAQTVMFDGKEGGEAAINHLDAALECLNTLASEGEAYNAAKTAAAKTA